MTERLVAHFLPSERGRLDLHRAPLPMEPPRALLPDVMEFDDLPPRGYLRAPWYESSLLPDRGMGERRGDRSHVRLPSFPGAVRLGRERYASP